MKLGYVILYVEDVEATMDFYERAFGLKKTFVTETKEYGTLATGDVQLAFVANYFVKTLMDITVDTASLKKSAPPMEIVFLVNDVEAAYQKALSAGATSVKKPTLVPWGQIMSYVRDNNGFLVEICSETAEICPEKSGTN